MSPALWLPWVAPQMHPRRGAARGAGVLGDILPVGPRGLVRRGDGPREKWPWGERWLWCFQGASQADRELSSLRFCLPVGFEAGLLPLRWGPSSGVLLLVPWSCRPARVCFGALSLSRCWQQLLKQPGSSRQTSPLPSFS